MTTSCTRCTCVAQTSFATTFQNDSQADLRASRFRAILKCDSIDVGCERCTSVAQTMMWFSMSDELSMFLQCVSQMTSWCNDSHDEEMTCSDDLSRPSLGVIMTPKTSFLRNPTWGSFSTVISKINLSPSKRTPKRDSRKSAWGSFWTVIVKSFVQHLCITQHPTSMHESHDFIIPVENDPQAWLTQISLGVILNGDIEIVCATLVHLMKEGVIWGVVLGVNIGIC